MARLAPKMSCRLAIKPRTQSAWCAAAASDARTRRGRGAGSGGPASQLGSTDELLGSDREGEAEGMKERAQLGRDAEDGAGDDADDGVEEAANDWNATKHEASLFLGRRVVRNFRGVLTKNRTVVGQN